MSAAVLFPSPAQRRAWSEALDALEAARTAPRGGAPTREPAVV